MKIRSKPILAVDIGNTSAHFALFERGRWTKEFRVQTSMISKSAALIQKRMKFSVDPVVVIASVVPSAVTALQKITHGKCGLKTHVLGKDFFVPIVNKYQDPKQVGVDRLLNAFAGYAIYKNELIIIDFGTAITLDLVSAQGEYLGGIIAPGIEISLDALFHKTALLPRIELAHPQALIGRNTRESIRVGCTVGIGGLCDRLVEELKKQDLRRPSVIATGGYARFMRRYCRSITQIHDRLALQGIVLSYQNTLRGSGPIFE